MTNTITHWINNKAFEGSGSTQPVTNPATGKVTGQVALATVEDARAVIDAAVAAFPAWRDTSLAKRGAILFNFRELLTPARVSWPRSSPASMARSSPTRSVRSAAAK